MEGALVSVATGTLRPVVGKLAALLGSEYKLLKSLRKEIESLSKELVAIHAFLGKKLEEENPNLQDKAWMTEVRELSYDIEDIIDEFMIRVDDKSTDPGGFISKCKDLLANFTKMKTQRRIAKVIQDLKIQVKEVGERHTRYRDINIIYMTGHALADPRAPIISEHSSFVGIDEPTYEVIALLSKNENDGCASLEQPSIAVSIVGFGGLGKTTLANQVYQKLKEQFEYSAFTSVSRNPDMVKILTTILSQVTQQDFADTESGDERQLLNKIYNFLSNKRYLVVIDDIWNKETWDNIKGAFPRNSCCSKIITTTRINDVAISCSSSLGHVYNIRPLGMAQSRKLFHGRLFNSEENCPPHLLGISDQILEKCDGLPLAIITISGLLANKNSKHQWELVKSSIGGALGSNEYDCVVRMMKILSLSYFDLPHDLKTCLLYLSVFPEDHTINKNNLTRMWIAEGFIHKKNGYTVFERGEMCFNELMNRSLIQPVLKDGYDDVGSCQVHDIIHDFIIRMSVEQNFVTFLDFPSQTVATHNKVRRLALRVHKQTDSMQPKSLILSHARSLSIFIKYSVKLPSLDEFKYLRVLNLEGFKLESHYLANIGRLFQLRYLNLYGTGLCELPEQIGCLRNLEMLDLRMTKVKKLPAWFARFGKLVELLIDKDDIQFLGEIVTMHALEILEVSVCRQSCSFLQGLGQLKNLRELTLNIDNYDESEGPTRVNSEHIKAVASSLRTLCTHNLRSLKIYNDASFDESFFDKSWIDHLNVLRELLICYGIPRVPLWMGSLINLEGLQLEVKKFTQDDLTTLGHLHALLKLNLNLIGEAVQDERLVTRACDGFRCLTKFNISGWEYRMDKMFEAGSMPKLELLDIWFETDKSVSLVADLDFDLGLKNISSLNAIHCRIFVPIIEMNTSNNVVQVVRVMEKAVSEHANHPKLYHRECLVCR